METTVKQAEEERNRTLENAKRLYEEYRPIKDQLDMMRASIGLESLPNMKEDVSKLTPQ